RMVADVVEVERHEPILPRPLDDRDIERPHERLGEQGQDVESHAGSTLCSTGPSSNSATCSSRGRSTSIPWTTAFGLPGRFTTRVCPRVTATPRVSAAIGV